MDNNISFSKIASTPTSKSWSQAHNAGKLFIVLSLEKTGDLPESEPLNTLGKDLLEHLEREFFAIETKNLEAIKNAISSVFLPKIEGANISFALATVVNNILYLFSLGNAKIFIKREGKLRLILHSEDAESAEIVSSSGFLKTGDLITVTTEAFSEVITKEDLTTNLSDDDPSQITESLAPKIHKSQNGKVSAIIMKYHETLVEETPEEVLVENELEEIQYEEEAMKKAMHHPFSKYFHHFESILKKFNFKAKSGKKFILVFVIIITAILIYSIFAGIQKQKNAKMRELFSQVYPQAQKKYEEGQGLVEFNKNYARDSYLAAQQILEANKGSFTENSKELTQVQDLLQKVEAGLEETSPIDKSGVDRSRVIVLVENGSGVEGAAGKAADILKNLGYSNVSTGNADSYDYEGIEIQAKSDQESLASLLEKELSKDYSSISTSSDLPSDSSNDAVVIIGK